MKAPAEIWARPARLDHPQDAAAYRRLLNAYASDPMGRGAPLPAAVLQRVTRDLLHHPGARVFLGGAGELAAGFATCFVGYSTFNARPLLNIHDIAVLPAQRGRGIARALLQAVAGEARALDCCKLTLEVREDNSAARALYRATGFGPAGGANGPVQYLFLERAL